MKTILLIDDDALLRKILTIFLKAHGYVTIAAENGLLGWQLIQQENRDLIIGDSIVPELDGIKILKRVRQNSVVSHIPFVVISGNKNAATQELAII